MSDVLDRLKDLKEKAVEKTEPIGKGSIGGVPVNSQKSEFDLAGAIENSMFSKPAEGEFDPYDPANIRIDQTDLNKGVAKKLLINIRVNKPKKQEFFRVHPSEDYRVTVALFEDEGDSIEKEKFIILPTARAYLNDNEYAISTLYLYVTRQGTPGIWPIRLENEKSNPWQKTSSKAALSAMTKWTRIAANMSDGQNDVFEAVADLGDPVWPDKSMRELLHIAFKDKIIDSEDHPMIRKLRGII
jgi:hypothetical protein